MKGNALNRRIKKKVSAFLQNQYDRMTGYYGFENGMHFVHREDGQRLYLSHKKRLSLYRNGVSKRIGQLIRDYRIPETLLRAGDVVIDVGANIGEIGLYAQSAGARYIGFEPDPYAYRALRENITSGDLFSLALGEKDDELTFYLATADADSSLFKPKNAHQTVVVAVKRLDAFLTDNPVDGNIRLLKVEAEGMEPEVLNGAIETLKRVEFVAVDAGPERGGENTVPACLNLLFSLGFTIEACFLFRGTFLLKNQNLDESHAK